MKCTWVLITVALVPAVTACGATLATQAKPADVGACQALGEVSAQAAPNATEDQRLTALRQKAAQAGATHVVPEEPTSSTDGSIKGKTYKCPEEEHTPTRSEQRMNL